ncbi:glycoside hydrolase family 27 protein [Kitasatospora sp. NPDC085464]|uniref:glycoside hydrolase family 27 protein n=1 Tax=Kitasatospora sp. NPDC085464 TaxID=3364063 RepID=UPI0037C74D91
MRRNRLPALAAATLVAAAGLTTGLPAQPAAAESAPGNIADHTLQATPTMIVRPGSWRQTNDALVRADTDAVVANGLAAKGWNIIAVDDDWMIKDNGQDWTGTQVVPAAQHGRDQAGNLITSPSKYPQGIKATIDYVHSKGLKFGIYEDGGDLTCDGGSGSYGHFTQDAEYFASLGVDYIKMDYCYPHTRTSTSGLLLTTDHDADVAIDAYRQAARAIAKANAAHGTHMTLNCSAPAYFNWDNQSTGSPVFQKVMAGIGQTSQEWRMAADVGGNNWAATLTSLEQSDATAGYARAGHFNDPDQLALGQSSMTPDQQRAQLSMWAMYSAPLNIKMTGAAAFTPQVVADAGNTDIIALDQDRLGVQATPVASDDDTAVYAKPLANGDIAVALLNKSATARTVSTTGTEVGTSASGFTLKDLWSKAVTSSSGTISATVPATSAVVYRLHPDAGATYADWTTALNSTAISDDDAATAGSFDRAGDSFSSDALAAAGVTRGSSVAAGGRTFAWPAGGSGQFDNIVARGQTIAFPTDGSTIGFLGASSGGDVSGALTLHFTDGTSGQATLGFPNWLTADPTAFGDSTAITTTHRNSPHGPDQFGTKYVVSYASVSVPDGKTLQSITLPDNAALHIFSLTDY